MPRAPSFFFDVSHISRYGAGEGHVEALEAPSPESYTYVNSTVAAISPHNYALPIGTAHTST